MVSKISNRKLYQKKSLWNWNAIFSTKEEEKIDKNKNKNKYRPPFCNQMEKEKQQHFPLITVFFHFTFFVKQIKCTSIITVIFIAKSEKLMPFLVSFNLQKKKLSVYFYRVFSSKTMHKPEYRKKYIKKFSMSSSRSIFFSSHV